MSGLSFLNQPLVWGMTLAAVPLIIHLLFRRKFRRIDWAPMKYLKLSMQRNRRRIRLEQLLLLLMRMAALALLFFFLARPVLHASGLGAWLRGRSRESQIILIDDSLSMGYMEEGRSAFDRARMLAEELLRMLRPKDRVTLVLASQPETPLLREVEAVDLDEIAKLLSGQRLSDSFVAWEATFSKLDELLASGTYPIREVSVITDLRRAGWDSDLSKLGNRWAGERVRLRLFDVGTPHTENVTLVDLEQSERLALVGNPVRWNAMIRNSTGRDVPEGEANFLVDGKPTLVRLPAILAGETASVPLLATFQEAGLHHVSLQLAGDALPADNARSRVIQVAETLNAVLVDGEPSSEPLGGEVDFLALALSLSASDEDTFRIEIANDSQWDWLSTSRPNLIALANVTSLTPDQAKQLKRLVESGVGLMIFPGDQLDLDNYNQLLFNEPTSLLPAALETAEDQEIAGLLLEDQDASPLEALGQLNPAVLARVKIRKFLRLNLASSPPPGVRVLARWNDAQGSPAAVEKTVGRGRVILWTVAADKSWSDWPTDPSYVLAMREACKGIARSDSSVHTLTAGESIRRQVSTTHEITEPTVEAPGAVHPLPLSTEITNDEQGKPVKTLIHHDTRLAGLYKLHWRDAQSAGPGDDLYAVNPDARESDLARITSADLRNLWGALQPQVIERSLDPDMPVAVEGQEIWRNLAVCLFGLLITEACLATWTGRQH